MKIARSRLLTGMLFLALTMSGSVWAQAYRPIVNKDAEFGWRVQENKKVTTGAGTTAGAAAVLKDNQLQNIAPGNAGSVDARSFDVSQPIAGGLRSPIGTNLVGTPGAGIANTNDGRNANVAPTINIPVLPPLGIFK